MKATDDPFVIANLAWNETHEINFPIMFERVMAQLDVDDPKDSREFLARVMEHAWKTGFACGLHFVAHGAVHAIPLGRDGKN